MEIPNGQRIIVNPVSNKQINQKVWNTVLVTNPLDPNLKSECRICHDEEESESLITPCKCSGSMACVHQTCLKTWIKVRSSQNETHRGPSECEVCHNQFVINQKRKMRISKCPEITAQDKLRHVIFCFSIFFMIMCLTVIFVAFTNMQDQTDIAKINTSYEMDDILLVVFGVAFFVSVFVAFISQRRASLSVIQVAKTFFRNSKEWTVSSIDKHVAVTAKEEVV